MKKIMALTQRYKAFIALTLVIIGISFFAGYGFGFEAELILKALKIKKNNIVEVPVNYTPRWKGDGKKFTIFDGLKIIWVILKYGLLNRWLILNGFGESIFSK